jgi:uncharacterized membrane protein YfcA
VFLGLTALAGFTGAFGVVAGLGGGVLLIGVMATIFPPAVLIPLHGAVLLGTNLGRSIMMRREILRHLLPAFMSGALVGAIIGGNVVVELPTGIMQTTLGVFILYLCWFPPPAAIAYSPRKFFALGAGGTLLGFFVGASGSLLAPFVAAACPDRQQFVATHAFLMTFVHALKILVFGFLGFTLMQYLPLILPMIAVSIAGSWVGRIVLRRMPEALFRRIFQIVLSLLAVRLLWAGAENAGWISF